MLVFQKTALDRRRGSAPALLGLVVREQLWCKPLTKG
jgi:hypothetical protein